MLSWCRSLVRPRRLAQIVAASNRRNLLLTSVCSRHSIHRPPLRPRKPESTLTPLIVNSRSIDDLQNVVMRNHRALEPSALLSCLISLKDMVERQESEFSPRESPLFQILSAKIIADLKSFTLDQVVRVLGVAGGLGVECSSPLVQKCCQTLTPRLEELDFNLLNSFSRALHQFRGTSALTESLMSSSTKIFESRMEKLDLSKFRKCFRALEFAVRVNLKVDKRDLVVDAAQRHLTRVHPIYALGVLSTVAFQRCDSLDPEDHKMHALLNDCLTIIARNISVFKSSQVQELMTAYSKLNIVERELHDALWSLAPSWSLDEIVQLVNLSIAKDAFSSKEAETLRILLEAQGEKIADAQETAETIAEDQASLLHRSIDLGKSRKQLRDVADMQDKAETIAEEQAKFLNRSLELCKSRERLRDFIEQNLHAMNSEFLLRCICQYRDLTTTEKGGFTAADDPFFEKLASTAALKLDSLNFHQCTVLLKIADQLQLDVSHVLVRRVLREITSLIPHMDLDQIMILSTRMRVIKGESPLKNDIMLSARLAFEIQVEEKLDRTKEGQCLRALEFTLGEVSNSAVQDFVIDAAQGFLAHASLTTTAEIINSLAHDKSDVVTVENPKVRNLIENCLTTLAKNLSKFDQKKVFRIMNAYGKIDVFSNELNEAVWAGAASLPFHEALRMFFSIPTRKTRLKDAENLKELLVTNKDKVRYVNAVQSAHLMALLALSSPGPHTDLEEIAPLLAEGLHRRPLPIVSPHVLAIFVSDLLVLGVFPEQDLDYLFSGKNQRKILSSRSESALHLITVERLLRMHFGGSCGYAVIPELREKAAALHKSWGLVQGLVDSVRCGLGGDQFVSLRVITPIGLGADLLVAKNSDGNLIDLSEKESPLEDLADGTRVVALLQCFRNNYNDDLETRKMTILLREHFMRAQNISPVVINMMKWKSLRSGEKVAFVMRKIEDAMREAPPYKQQLVWESRWISNHRPEVKRPRHETRHRTGSRISSKAVGDGELYSESPGLYTSTRK